MTSFDNGSDHDEPVDSRTHQRLLDAVGRLSKTQFIKKPTRNEPAIRRSEFHLVKNTAADVDSAKNVKTSTVSVSDLVKTLNKTKTHLNIGKELQTNDKNKKVLAKPLEKPVADRIARSLGYEKAKKKLSRWNAIVTRNRSTDHMSFPLKQDVNDIEVIHQSSSDYSRFRIKSDLALALEKLEPKVEQQVNDEPEDQEDSTMKLSRAEMIARTKELRLLRIRESQKSAKARMQNKIKSKKFHNILKKEKLREHIKEFEALQKEDPEAAMRKLDQIEKNRSEERALLRHKNTGSWAKNLQVRAKYDKDVRKELAQQLAISRELTKKQEESEEEEEAEPTEQVSAEGVFNPWLKSDGDAEAAQEAADSVGGYRKYWNARNEDEDALKKWRAENSRPTPIKLKPKVIRSKLGSGWLVQEVDDVAVKPETLERAPKKSANHNSDNIDDLFDEAEDTIRKKVTSKLAKLKQTFAQPVAGNKRSNNQRKETSDMDALSFKRTSKKPNIDEQLDYGLNDDAETQRKALEDLQKTSSRTTTDHSTAKAGASANINPNTFMQVKPKHLRTALPDMEGDFGESDEESGRINDKRLTIAEAFEDDDIMADFERDQEDERRKKEPTDINLTLPGWGSWAGSGIQNQNRTKKLILKFPKEEVRRDENKGHVIIVDNDNMGLRNHQVSQLPFPFTNVAEYEASIRAPIGSDFVPAVAHQLLTKPAVTTQLGAIIEPMREEMLLRKMTAPRTKTTKKIAELNKQASQRRKSKF